MGSSRIDTPERARELHKHRTFDRTPGFCIVCGCPFNATPRRRYCSAACSLKAYRRRGARRARHIDMTGFIVEDRAQEVIVRKRLEARVRQMAELVENSLEPKTYRGGSIVYQESLESPDDWEIIVVSKLGISRQERFDLSLRIGEALSQLIASSPYDPNWMHVTFSLELA